MLLALALALPSGAGAEQKKPAEWDRAGWHRDVAWITGASALDYASTRYALEQCSECYEGNPVHRWNLEVSKVATTALLLWGLRELRRRGHERAATWARWGVVVVLLAVSGWNRWQGSR